ncbi:hypothetical protein TNCV_2498511 [Trichonephila clavipes]|nr:hypothetical protein TNCV_2498511 [Trichonephila clavipes]
MRRLPQKNSERHLEIAWMGHPFAPAVLLISGAIRISPFRINGARARRAALQQFRRSSKTARRMFFHKRQAVFLAWYS